MAWHNYSFKLSDFEYVDGTSDFDTSAITVFQVLSEGNGAPDRLFAFNYIFTGEQSFGCTNPEAANFEPSVTIDDGSCFFSSGLAEELSDTWKLAPIEGAMRVGPAPNDGQWWSNSAAELLRLELVF